MSAFDGGGKILRRLDRRIRRHHDHLDLLGEARDRRHLFERHRRFVHGERAHHDEAVDHQLVAVALGAVDELRDADAAAGAGHVGDLDAAGDLGGDQRLLHRACGLIPSAAGRGGRHDLELELLREGRRAWPQVSMRRPRRTGAYETGSWGFLQAHSGAIMCQFVAYQPEKRAAVQKDCRLPRHLLRQTRLFCRMTRFRCVEHDAKRPARCRIRAIALRAIAASFRPIAGDVRPAPPRAETPPRSACRNGRRS